MLHSPPHINSIHLIRVVNFILISGLRLQRNREISFAKERRLTCEIFLARLGNFFRMIILLLVNCEVI